MTFIAEYAPDKRRGFFGSWLEMGTLTGYTLGASIVVIIESTLSDPQLLSWGGASRSSSRCRSASSASTCG